MSKTPSKSKLAAFRKTLPPDKRRIFDCLSSSEPKRQRGMVSLAFDPPFSCNEFISPDSLDPYRPYADQAFKGMRKLLKTEHNLNIQQIRLIAGFVLEGRADQFQIMDDEKHSKKIYKVFKDALNKLADNQDAPFTVDGIRWLFRVTCIHYLSEMEQVLRNHGRVDGLSNCLRLLESARDNLSKTFSWTAWAKTIDNSVESETRRFETKP